MASLNSRAVFKRFIMISCIILVTYYLSSSIVWKPVLDLSPEHSSKDTKRHFTLCQFKTDYSQPATQEAPKRKQVLKDGHNVQFDIKPQNRSRVRNKNRKQTIALRNNLIILSQGRSGSSFLGGIFNCHPEIMYWFEPLFDVGNLLNVNLFKEKEPMAYKETCIRVLDSFFKCNFSNITKPILSELSSSRFRLHSRALTSGSLCPGQPKSKPCASLSKNLLSKACNLYKHTVVKILSSRLPNYTIESFQEHFTYQKWYNVKFINLVRDPRAVVYSWVNSNWVKNHSDLEFRKNVHKICDPIEKNVRYGLLSPPSWLKNRFMVIRYEDLVVNTTNIARDLYKFARFDWSTSVDKWIRDHKRSRNSAVDKNPYSLYRNASAVINKWKREASPGLITVVEEVCGSLMNIMGYTKWSKNEK